MAEDQDTQGLSSGAPELSYGPYPACVSLSVRLTRNSAKGGHCQGGKRRSGGPGPCG